MPPIASTGRPAIEDQVRADYLSTPTKRKHHPLLWQMAQRIDSLLDALDDANAYIAELEQKLGRPAA